MKEEQSHSVEKGDQLQKSFDQRENKLESWWQKPIVDRKRFLNVQRFIELSYVSLMQLYSLVIVEVVLFFGLLFSRRLNAFSNKFRREKI